MSGNLPKNIAWFHLDSLLAVFQKAHYHRYDPQTNRMVRINVTQQDKLDFLKSCIECTTIIDNKRYMGLICLDAKGGKQSAYLFGWLLPLVEEAGYKTSVAHESDYFCNRGYYYGNVLKMYLIEVTENV